MSTKKTLLAILILAAIVSAYYFYRAAQIPGPGTMPGPVACTLEAKLCPDGSSVARTGPNCEFAACPNSITTKVSYQVDYPSADILVAMKIRPEVEVKDNNQTAACKSNALMSYAQPVTINGINFIYSPLQANGQEFVSVYTTVKENTCYQILFRIGDRSSQLDSPAVKSAEEMTEQILSTFRFTK